MAISANPIDSVGGREVVYLRNESNSSGVAWGAVIGGAFVAAGLYLALLALGAGFGLSVISPWSTGSHIPGGVAAIIWLLIMEVVSSGFGGYLTGRLRTKWAQIHTDEVYFRDTANGFLSWAVAFVVSAGLLASATAFMAGGSLDSPVAIQAASTAPNAYYVDELMRDDPAPADPASLAVRGVAERIFDNDLHNGLLLTADQDYLAQVVAQRTRISPADASKRVTDVFTQAQLNESAARKTTAHILLWLFVSCILGAFSASFAATIGGRQRDHVPAV